VKLNNGLGSQSQKLHHLLSALAAGLYAPYAHSRLTHTLSLYLSLILPPFLLATLRRPLPPITHTCTHMHTHTHLTTCCRAHACSLRGITPVTRVVAADGAQAWSAPPGAGRVTAALEATMAELQTATRLDC
jgi:hypothetical protein